VEYDEPVQIAIRHFMALPSLPCNSIFPTSSLKLQTDPVQSLGRLDKRIIAEGASRVPGNESEDSCRPISTDVSVINGILCTFRYAWGIAPSGTAGYNKAHLGTIHRSKMGSVLVQRMSAEVRVWFEVAVLRVVYALLASLLDAGGGAGVLGKAECAVGEDAEDEGR
jgi:hypothetical protein